MHTRFHGLVAAPYTPFRRDGTLNVDVIPSYAQLLRQNGVSAAFVNGTTGEGLSLTLDERLQVSEAWLAAAGTDLPVIVHVGHTALPGSLRLAAHAASTGAAAIATIAPAFFRARNVEELVVYCAEIAAAAPALPFYFYHMPSMVGADFPMIDFLALAGGRIPNLAGVKYTHENLADYRACVAFDGGRYDILFGRDELLMEGLGCRAQGAVGSTYNYAAPLYQRIFQAMRQGDETTALRWQEVSRRMIAQCNGIGVTHLAASKAIMAWLGVDCGPVRLPLQQPSEEALADLRRRLESIGFFDFASRGERAPVA